LQCIVERHHAKLLLEFVDDTHFARSDFSISTMQRFPGMRWTPEERAAQ